MKHLTHDTLNLFVDGNVSSDRRREIVEHLKQCDICSREHKSLQAIRSRIHAVPPFTLPDDFATTVSDAVRLRDSERAEWTAIERTAERVLTSLALVALLLWALSASVEGTSEKGMESTAGLLDVYIRDSSMVRLATSETLTREDVLAAVLQGE